MHVSSLLVACYNRCYSCHQTKLSTQLQYGLHASTASNHPALAFTEPPSLKAIAGQPSFDHHSICHSRHSCNSSKGLPFQLNTWIRGTATTDVDIDADVISAQKHCANSLEKSTYWQQQLQHVSSRVTAAVISSQG